jgi:hypothetical protein
MYSLIQELYAASGGEYNPKRFKVTGIRLSGSFQRYWIAEFKRILNFCSSETPNATEYK